MRYQVRHRTTYHYQSEVTIGYNELMLSPRTTAWQKVLQHDLVVRPQPTLQRDHADFFGNTTTYIELQTLHTRLEVELQAQVEVVPRPVPDGTPAWEAVLAGLGHAHGTTIPETLPFTLESTYARATPTVMEYARPSFETGRPVLEAALDLTHRIYHDFKFQSGCTTIGTPQDEVLKNRKGVCQDFAHLQIACLRGLGLPARYVSGYLLTMPPPGKPRLIGADASHAWLSLYCGEPHGWVDLDPTNDVIPSDKHITLAWGMDYRDVSPVRGIVLGGGEQRLDVGVDVIPLDLEPALVS